MACCFTGEKSDENKPLLSDQKADEKDTKSKPTKTSKLVFIKLDVREFDKVFEDFARTLNPFVCDRERLEQAVTKFKTAVESLQDVHPQATFRDYVQELKTSLKEEGILIKIKNGAVEVYGVAGRSIKAVENVVDAIKNIIATSQSLKDMPGMIKSASGSAVQDAEESVENLDNIIRREFSGVFDLCKVCRFKKNLKKNLGNMKTAPTMVQDFCEEVKMIVDDISEAFDEDKNNMDDNEMKDAKSEETTGHDKENKGDKENNSKGNKGNAKQQENEKSKVDVAESENSKKGKKSKSTNTKQESKNDKDDNVDSKTAKTKDDEKKTDYHKQLKMETIGLPDVDKIFTDVMATLNKFIGTREKMQQARESFEKIMKTLCNFDGKKELKEYINELKKKAIEGDIHIYVDITDGGIRLDSAKGVDPPAPYRNAVKALNDVNAAAKNTIDLEPEVQNDLEACARDITKIEPLKDFKKMVSGVKETMTIPKKVKAFNNNRKKVQQAPQIVKEFCLYVKQIVVDIANVFNEEGGTEKRDESNDEEKVDTKTDQQVEVHLAATSDKNIVV